MSSIFQQNAKKQPKRNQFDLGYANKLTTVFGRLTPFYVEDGVLPGDEIRVNSELMSELAPLLSNLKHMIDVHVDFFYVPYDQVWSNFRDFISGGENYDQYPVIPHIQYNDANKADFKTGTLMDYLGFPVWNKDGTPPTVSGSVDITTLSARCYQHIYNEWYRDEDLQTKIDFGKDTDGAQSGNAVLQIRNSAWEKDLFTSARPTAQKGVPINFTSSNEDHYQVLRFGGSGTPVSYSAGLQTQNDGVLELDSGTNVFLSNIETSIAELRKAEAMQRYVEAMQRGGNRYNEYLNTMWGVDDQDARLDIPYLLYSSDHPLQINEVITTTNADNVTTDDNTAGQAYGRAKSYNSQGFSFKAPDYGCIMGIVKFAPKAAYFQGLPKRFIRRDRLDWYTDHLALIGEDVIQERELFFTHTSPGTDATTNFGYHHRYYDFKTRQDQVCGDFRYSLKFQHLARELNASPTLNANFIEMGGQFDSGLTRIFNVTNSDDDYIWLDIYNDAIYNRDVAYHSTPMG
jgi:hypothetical protein